MIKFADTAVEVFAVVLMTWVAVEEVKVIALPGSRNGDGGLQGQEVGPDVDGHDTGPSRPRWSR